MFPVAVLQDLPLPCGNRRFQITAAQHLSLTPTVYLIVFAKALKAIMKVRLESPCKFDVVRLSESVVVFRLTVGTIVVQ